MANAIVVDDEWYNLNEISELVEKTDFLHVVGRYQNPLCVLEDLDKTGPDVAFIDIEMPEMDGITLAETLLERRPSTIIVFITGWDRYAVKAFELNALDYILKPVKLERFSKMVAKIREELDQENRAMPRRLQVKCFGSFETTVGGVPVKWERAKAEELFAYLLMNHGRFVHKETIIEDLWPANSPEKALPILQTAICKIRKVFAPSKQSVGLEYSGNRYCLTLRDAECDLLELERRLARVQYWNTLPDIEYTCLLYKNGFLAQQGYLWSIEKDEQIRRALLHRLGEHIPRFAKDDLRKTPSIQALLQERDL